MFCAKCGTELNGAAFCPNCGTKSGEQVKSIKKKSIRKIIAIAVLGLSVAALLVIALLVLLYNRDFSSFAGFILFGIVFALLFFIAANQQFIHIPSVKLFRNPKSFAGVVSGAVASLLVVIIEYISSSIDNANQELNKKQATEMRAKIKAQRPLDERILEAT